MAFLLVASAAGNFVGSTNAQNSGACTSSNTFRMSYPIPPDAVNELIAATRTGFVLAGLLYFLDAPPPLPNGTPDTVHAGTTYSHNVNNTVWIFNAKNLTWSNGTPLSAQDILATWGPKFALNSSYDFPNLSAEIKSETAINSTAVKFVLNQPDAQFEWTLGALYYTPIMPASAINQEGPSGTYFNAPALGPFYIAQYTPGSFQMILKRNPYYRPLPNICQIDLNFVESYSLTATYLQGGQTDLAPMEPANVASVLTNPYMKLYQNPAEGETGIQMNVTVYPYNVTAFRQALVYSINDSAFIKTGFLGYAIPGYTSQGEVPPTDTSVYNPNQMTYSFNISKARSLLKTMGITMGSDGYLQYRNGTDVSLTIWADTDQTWDTAGASAIQKSMEQVGFKVNVVTASSSAIVGDYSSNVDNIQHALILYTNLGVYSGSTWADMQPGWDIWWETAVAPNNGIWEQPAIAQTEYSGNYTAFSRTTNPAQQQPYVDNIQAINAQYIPGIIVSWDDQLWAANTQNWTGWPSNSTGYIMYSGNILNQTALATLKPVSTSPVTVTSSPTTSASSATGTTTPIGKPSSFPYDTIVIGAAVVVLVVAIVVAALIRRPPRRPK